MRYIRTKEGIIVDTTKYKNVVERTFRDKVVAIDLNHWGQDNDKYPTWIDVKDIIKQADTIEELCDVLISIVFDGHGKPHWDIRWIHDRTWKKDFKNNSDWSIYGAIWTDKGLIYVAEMNKKGELELL